MNGYNDRGVAQRGAEPISGDGMGLVVCQTAVSYGRTGFGSEFEVLQKIGEFF